MRNHKSIDMAPMAREASELLSAMGNEKRLMILCHLRDGEMSVNELARLVGMNQSALSQQLARLRALRLVDTRREAQQIHYRLSSESAAKVIATLYGIYCAPGEEGVAASGG